MKDRNTDKDTHEIWMTKHAHAFIEWVILTTQRWGECYIVLRGGLGYLSSKSVKWLRMLKYFLKLKVLEFVVSIDNLYMISEQVALNLEALV